MKRGSRQRPNCRMLSASAAHKTEDRIAELKKQADQKSAVLANLRRNIKDYPHGLLLFKDRLERIWRAKQGMRFPFIFWQMCWKWRMSAGVER